MGRNSKAKRDARRKKERRPAAPLGTAAGIGRASLDVGLDDSALNRTARSACSECGSTELAWMTTGELRDQVPDDLRARVQEGVDFLGADGQAWLCRDCGGFGIMSGSTGTF